MKRYRVTYEVDKWLEMPLTLVCESYDEAIFRSRRMLEEQGWRDIQLVIAMELNR